MSLNNLFEEEKPIIGMLHLKGINSYDVLERVKRELDIMIRNDVDAVLIENYFNRERRDFVEMVLRYIQSDIKDLKYGVNFLDNYAAGFIMSLDYNAKFVQLDSVAGHLTPKKDKEYENILKGIKKDFNKFVLGGVRFKYQPHLSGNDLKADLLLAKQRCHAVVVTGSKTGEQTELEKIKEFKKYLEDFPLVVGAGLNCNNCQEQLLVADAGIVGSYFKEDHIDSGEMCEKNVKEFMGRVKVLRRKL